MYVADNHQDGVLHPHQRVKVEMRESKASRYTICGITNISTFEMQPSLLYFMKLISKLPVEHDAAHQIRVLHQ